MTLAEPAEERYADPRQLAEEVRALPAPLLLCTDIDGTLSAIAPRPSEAHLVPGADVALHTLARSGIEVAVVSGRSREELIRQFRLPRTLHLVGSHGVEDEQSPPPTDHETALLERVGAILDEVAAAHPGAEVERKPFAAALHVRRCVPDDARGALQAADRAIGAIDGVTVIVGHMVYEVALRAMTKADAVAALRSRIEPAAVVFVGDDHSDERVFELFAKLPGDERPAVLGVKVGPGTTSAAHRLRTPEDVLILLQTLIELIGADVSS